MKVSRHHKRISLKTKVVDRIEKVPVEEWKGVFPDILEGYEFFKTLDESGFDQFTLRYILVYDRDKLVGATPCFLMNYSLDTSINGPLRRLSNLIKKMKPGIFSIKAVICGAPMGQGRIGTSAPAKDTLEAVLRRMERMARKEKAPIVAFKDFDKTYTCMLDPLRKEGFSRFDSLPTTEMDVRFKDFEEYLMTLSSASRYDLRRKFKKAASQSKIELEIMDEPDEDTFKEIYRLYQQMVDKHDMGFEIVPADFFKNIAKNMPAHAKFFLWRIEGKLAAFLMALVSKEVLIDYYLGLDYEVALKYHLYFVKFRDVMNWAIANKIKKYDMGITGYEPKRRLGFEFVPLYIYAKHRNAVIRPIFNFVCQFLKFENFDSSLKRAKKQAKA